MRSAWLINLKKPKFMISASSVLEFREPRVEFRAGVNLEALRARLPGLQDEARHAHRAFHSEKRRRIRMRQFERARPHFRALSHPAA